MTEKVQSAYLIGALEENHTADAALAIDLVRLAAEAGCDAVSLRRWNTEGSFAEEFLREPHAGATRAEVLRALEMPLAGAAKVREACADAHIAFVATPYDAASLAELATLGPDAYQVEPALLGQVDLLRLIAAAGKPVYLVAGRCTEDDIAGALAALNGASVTLMHSVASRGMAVEDTLLGLIPHLASRFDRPVGYYGAEPGIEAAIAAHTLGARVIEKPFTTDHRLPGSGHATSLDRDELRRLVTSLRALGPALAARGPRVPSKAEIEEADTGRATLVAARDLVAGDVLSSEMLETRLGGRGISPLQSERILGKPIAYNVAAGVPITFGVVGEAS